MPVFPRSVRIRQIVVRASLSAIALLGAACADVTPTALPDPSPRYAGSPRDTTGPTVTSVKPNKSLRGVTLDVRVFGSGFDEGSTVKLALNGVTSSEVVTNSTTYVNSRELIANVTISPDADGALYDVVVTAASGKPGIGTESFEITVEMTLLSTLGETTQAGATGINEAGDISGYSYTPSSGARAMLWTKGVPRNLGVVPGFNESRADGLNNRGQVIGTLYLRNGYVVEKQRAFVWSREAGIKILQSPSESWATAINDAGMVLGNAKDETGRWRVAVWTNGVIQFLPPQAFTAYDMNSRGEVVGSASPFGDGDNWWSSAFIWSPQQGLRYLNTLFGSYGEALGINDNGDVVGWGPRPDDFLGYAFAVRRGFAQNLAATGGESSVGMKIAGNGLVVGRGQNTAAIWSVKGKMLLLPTPIGGVYVDALDMNSRGEAVGSVQLDSRNGFEQRAIKWRVY